MAISYNLLGKLAIDGRGPVLSSRAGKTSHPCAYQLERLWGMRVPDWRSVCLQMSNVYHRAGSTSISTSSQGSEPKLPATQTWADDRERSCPSCLPPPSIVIDQWSMNCSPSINVSPCHRIETHPQIRKTDKRRRAITTAKEFTLRVAGRAMI